MGTEGEGLAGHAPSAEDVALAGQYESLDEMLARLTPRQRQLVEVFVAHPDWSNKEIARALSIAESTVRGRWMEVRVRLQGQLSRD
jgi:DNA-directed RNA polymerase specialized sigma24 family protein